MTRDHFRDTLAVIGEVVTTALAVSWAWDVKWQALAAGMAAAPLGYGLWWYWASAVLAAVRGARWLHRRLATIGANVWQLRRSRQLARAHTSPPPHP